MPDRTVRVRGNSAVITAKLWAKDIEDGAQVDHEMWFSDTSVRTSGGPKYVFGPASLPQPNSARK